MFYSGWLVPARAGVISERLGKHEAVKRRYYRWIEMDVLDAMFEALAREADMETWNG
jgi:anti-sigma factor RsiW